MTIIRYFCLFTAGIIRIFSRISLNIKSKLKFRYILNTMIVVKMTKNSIPDKKNGLTE